MKINEYQDLATRTCNTSLGLKDACANYAMGLAGEGGEVANKVKKQLYHKIWRDTVTTEQRHEVLDELGDVLWYVAALAHTYGLTLEQVAHFNVEKLKKRWPKGMVSGKDPVSE